LVVIALFFTGAGTSTLSCPVASYLPVSQPLTYMMQETPHVGMNKKHDTKAGNKEHKGIQLNAKPVISFMALWASCI